MVAVRLTFVLLAAGLASCSTPPTVGYTTVDISTDAPLRVANRVRIDAFADDGTWEGTRESAIATDASWPISLTIAPNTSNTTRRWLRIRAWNDGVVAVTNTMADNYPAASRTGSNETQPSRAVIMDRLAFVDVSADNSAHVAIVLYRACAGTESDWSARTTCVDTAGVRVPAPAAASDALEPLQHDGRDCQTPLQPDRLGAEGTPLYNDQVCIPGGAFVVGARRALAMKSSIETDDDLPALEPRVFEAPTMRADRYEVTVGRWRDAVARGFSPPSAPREGNSTFANEMTGNGQAFCTYTSKALPAKNNRDAFAVTCLTGESAAAFCKFEGGDLPSDEEWEWLASSSGRATATLFPWGDDKVSCDEAVYARYSTTDRANDLVALGTCRGEGQALGPRPVNELGVDRTPNGLVGLAGNVREYANTDTPRLSLSGNRTSWTITEHRRVEISTKAALPRPESPNLQRICRLARGGSWGHERQTMTSSWRSFEAGQNGGAYTGFRCVYREPLR